jgi:NDP-sugar pyrophosphorylase family protein
MTEKLKYEILTDNYRTIEGSKIYRIRALRDFGNVSAGDIGGYIESEANLEQKGEGWIFGDAIVKGNAILSGNAKIFEGVTIFDNAQVSGKAKIYGHCCVGGNSKIHEDARLYGHIRAFGNVEVYGKAELNDYVYLQNNAKIFGDTCIKGHVTICGPAHISSNNDYVVITNIGSEFGTLTAFKNETGDIYLNRGCFTGSLSEFLEAVYKKHGDSKHSLCYDAAAVLIKQMLTN